jgi:hypothetical protein
MVVVVMNKDARKHYNICALALTSGDTLSNIKENLKAPLWKKIVKTSSYTNTASKVHSSYVRLLATKFILKN